MGSDQASVVAQIETLAEGKVLKARRRLEKLLAEHLLTLEEYRRRGGYTSYTEKEIRNFRGQLNAIDEVRRRNS